MATSALNSRVQSVVSGYSVLILAIGLVLCTPMSGQTVQAPVQTGAIMGTVTDVNGDAVPDAAVSLEELGSGDPSSIVTKENGFFEFHDVKAGVSYRVSIKATGFADWQSPPLAVEPGQFKILTDIELRIEIERTTINVTYDPVQVATEQVKIEERQKVLGFIPNYYVVYDRDAAPLTAKLKFDLALKTSVNPVTIGGVGLYSGMQQAGDTPNYGQGMKGYGKRFGANAAGGLSDIMIGGAILPSLLRQDPRYFYQGTRTTSSRIRHAVSNPFVCKGDNGKWQPNYSSMGGDLASSAISNAYYPGTNRGVGLVFGNFAISTAERMVSGLAQEFVLRRFTHKAEPK